jgi:hypothetical protein
MIIFSGSVPVVCFVDMDRGEGWYAREGEETQEREAEENIVLVQK